jgi:hypothetical protein
MRANVWKFPVAVGAVLALATTAGAAAIDLPSDEYMCYQSGASKVPAQSKFAGAEISSKDQFENTLFRNLTASKILKHCNPVTVPASPGGNASVHLVEYGIKDSKAHPNTVKFAAPGTAFNLVDRFNMTPITVTISKPKSVLVRSAKSCDSTAPCPVAPAPQLSNLAGTSDFTCYSVKAPKLVPIAAGTFDDQFGEPATYSLTKITEVCAPTNKGNGGSLGPDTTAPQKSVHLLCYAFKRTALTKFVAHHVEDGDSMIFPLTGLYLDAKKPSQVCIPALKAAAPGVPALTTPTKLIAETAAAGGVCGSLTTNAVGEGVQGRLDPANPATNPNAACTSAGLPKACCTGAAAGHCDEGTSVTCGSLTFGGGGGAVLQPGTEGATAAGSRTSYGLNCAGNPLGTCTISGDAGNPSGGLQCSLTGCGGTTPVDTTSPLKVCAISKLGGPATGTLDLASGSVSLGTNTSTTVNLLTTTSFANHGCPRCRATTSTGSAEVFATGPNTPGAGVCDTDSSNSGASCLVFEPAGSGQGLSSDCIPVAVSSAVIAITTTSATAGGSVSDPSGHFCPGQGGNADCTGSGAPIACCTGSGTGSCGNFDGCFGSGKFVDTPATCTGIAVTGSKAGFLVAGDPGSLGAYGAVGCIPPVPPGGLGGTVNTGAGLPGPVVSSSKATLTVTP